MYLQGWQHFLLTILVASISGSGLCIQADAAKVKPSDRLYCQNQIDNDEKDFDIENRNSTRCQTSKNSPLSQLDGFNRASRRNSLLDIIATKSLTPEVISTDEPNFIPPHHSISQQNNESPQLEGQPGFVPQPNQKPMEPLLNSPPVNYRERLERLRQRLQEAKQPSSEGESYRELGLRVRERPLSAPIEQPPPPPAEQPQDKFKPIGSLQAYVGYFHTDNTFSSDISPTEDGLLFYGLRLASAYFSLGKSTYLSGSIDGNLIRYVDQTKYNYNQLAFNLGIYQQLSKRMYGEIGWSNQQFFYAKNSDVFQAGNRFLNENSWYLSLGRRDPITDKLTLDSFYELSWKLADPDNRSRIMNSFWLSLSYSLQKPLQIGLNYQLNLSDFTEREPHRTDQYHRLYGSMVYRVSDSSSLNLQTGFSFGDSTASNIDFDGWFLNVNYHLKIGEF